MDGWIHPFIQNLLRCKRCILIRSAFAASHLAARRKNNNNNKRGACQELHKQEVDVQRCCSTLVCCFLTSNTASYGALINDCLTYWDQEHIKYFPVFRPLLYINMEVFFYVFNIFFAMIRFTVSAILNWRLIFKQQDFIFGCGGCTGAMSSSWSAGCTLILNWSHVNNFISIFNFNIRPNWKKKWKFEPI